MSTPRQKRYCAFCDNTGWRTPGLFRKFPCDRCHRGAVVAPPVDETARALEAELAEAKAQYARILEDLTPYNETIEYGSGWFGRAQQVRHDQLTARLDEARQRVWAAEDAIARQTAAAVA